MASRKYGVTPNGDYLMAMFHRDAMEFRRTLIAAIEQNAGIVEDTIRSLDISRNFFVHLLKKVDLTHFPAQVREERRRMFRIFPDGNPGSRPTKAA